MSADPEVLAIQEVEALRDACTKELGEFGLNLAVTMVNFQAGQHINVDGKLFQLGRKALERAVRLREIDAFLKHPTPVNEKFGPTLNTWLNKDDQEHPGAVPKGDWTTATGKVSGKSLYGAAAREFQAYFADKQPI